MTGTNTKRAIFTVTWFTVFTWVPVALLFGLPNDWYWVLLKVPVAISLLGILRTLWFSQSNSDLGWTGPGFVVSAALFAVLFFPIPTWLRFVIGGLLGLLLFPMFDGLRRIYAGSEVHKTDP